MSFDIDLADNTIAYAFDGPMDDKTINALREQIEAKLAIHECINIYLEDRSIDHFTLYSVFMGVFYPLMNYNRFLKVAMVTDRAWIHLLSTMNNMMLSGDIRNFITEDREQAIDWITDSKK